MSTIVIMAGGTGGHIYPALAVSVELRTRGVKVYWMGVRNGLEDQLARSAGFEFDPVRIQGLWGKGWRRWITLPVWLLISFWQSVAIILRRRPDLLLGMGGYVCGPGGLAAVLLRRPLIIHESNAIAGLTNRILATVAHRILTGFKNTDLGTKAICTGTPVRAEILAAAERLDLVDHPTTHPLHLLVIGGSQGAGALNQTVPIALAGCRLSMGVQVTHQTGRGHADLVSSTYERLGVPARVLEYIDDMASAYSWADVVIARAGAMTLAELSVMGLAAVLVPFPYAARNHQLANAQMLSQRDAAVVCIQGAEFEVTLRAVLRQLLGDRAQIQRLAANIRRCAQPAATTAVVKHCMNAAVS